MRVGRGFLAAVIAVAVNSISVVVLSSGSDHTQGSRSPRLLTHAALIAPGWVWFGGELRALERAGSQRRRAGGANALGVAIEASGWAMVAAGFRVVGLGALVNADLFAGKSAARRTDGIYRLFPHPIYTGYGLIVLGRGLRRRAPAMIAMAPWLLILLLAVEVAAEDHAYSRRNRGLTAIPRGRH